MNIENFFKVFGDERTRIIFKKISDKHQIGYSALKSLVDFKPDECCEILLQNDLIDQIKIDSIGRYKIPSGFQQYFITIKGLQAERQLNTLYQ